MLKRVTNHCFLKIPVNAVPHRATGGIFNNQKLIIHLWFELPPCLKLSKNLPKYNTTYISLLFYIFLSAFLLSKSTISKNSSQFYISIFLLFSILLRLLMWLCGRLVLFSENAGVNAGPKIIWMNVCQLVTGASTAYLPMTIIFL